jgi:hypothetical protein
LSVVLWFATCGRTLLEDDEQGPLTQGLGVMGRAHPYSNIIRDDENGYTVTCKFDSIICYQSTAPFPFVNVKLILISIYTNSMLLART